MRHLPPREFDEMPEEYGRIVSMIRFGDTTLIATERRIFRLKDDTFEAMRFRIIDDGPAA